MKTAARVQVTVEITTGNWSDECTVAQVHKQAAAEALNQLAHLIQGSHWRVVGQPRVQAVVIDDEGRQ